MKMNLMNTFQLVCVEVKLEHGHQNNHLKLSVENICWINIIIFQKNLKIKSFQDRSYWVGIKIVPTEFEFWEGGEFRIHKERCFF